jgi:hypothetical protein
MKRTIPVTFEVLSAALIQIKVFWAVTPHGLVSYGRFGVEYCRNVKGLCPRTVLNPENGGRTLNRNNDRYFHSTLYNILNTAHWVRDLDSS